jgi:hypothetical protein
MSNQTPPFLKSSQPRRWKIQELTGAFDLQVTQVAAAQGTASGSPNAGNGTRRVSPPPGLAGTPAAIFSVANAEQLRRLFEAHGVEFGSKLDRDVSTRPPRRGLGK